MNRVNRNFNQKTMLLKLLSSVVAVSAFSFASVAGAAQQFIESDGVTVVDVEPAFKNPDGTSGHHGDPGFLEANHGAFEGGPTGTLSDTRINLQVPESVQLGGGGFNVPTGAPPSPDFGVQPYTQKLLRFEEFGPEPLPAEGSYTPGGSFPLPVSAQSGPDSVALDTFLKQDIYPYPSRLANTSDENPWKLDIETFLGRALDHPPAEGRPPQEWWAHQRWDDFYPETYFQAAQAGARTNGGLRDDRQRHGYAVGEFGPGGLYHNTVGGTNPDFNGKTKGIQIRFHPDMPLQQENTIYTFDGTLPPKLLNVRYGEGVLFRHYNALPIDPSANNGFGIHTISTQEHNGHNPAESDGYTNSFFFPGQYYDYRWPVQLASYDSLNINATDPKAAYPCKAGETLTVKGVVKECEVVGTSGVGTIKIPGNHRETMSTHWFHDHMLDFTAQNVYKGNAAMMNYYSAIDRGNEAIDDGVNLRFPSGSALDWGNRDYDVNLLIAGKAWDTNGQLFYNVFNTDGFLGDRMLVNWLYKPTMDVRARKYRLRLLNGSVSRYIKLAMVTESGTPVPFHMIANDGNIMEHSLAFPNGILPTQAIAERYDIIVDFSRYAPGTKLYLVNLMEHKNGRKPERAVPLADVLNGSYKPVIVDGEWKNGDPVVGKFMQFNVVPMAEGATDQSMDPALYEVGGLKMLELPKFTQTELDNAVHRTFDFGRSNGTDDKPWTVKTDGGMGFNMDPRRVSAAPEKGKGVEIWHMTTGGGWAHPIHIHFEEGQILTRDGMTPPLWETLSRKDVYRIGPEVDSSREVQVAIRFREFSGTYMKHCHNTQHEDTAMLMRWDVDNPGQTLLLPTPMPTWDGVEYADSHALATFRSGDLNADPVVLADPPVPANGGDVNNDGVIDRIFDDETLRLKAPLSMELAQVPDMSDVRTGYLKDEAMAIALGKAFFWDQTVGSDGQACASCHFSAGADNRSKNQLSPGASGSFEMGGINSQLVHSNFPFAKGVDEIAGSQGTFDAVLKSESETTARQKLAAQRSGVDLCTKLPSDFSLGGLNYRKTTGRNAPSVINAVFNHRNFYDGRANNQFNGVDPHGARSNLNGTVGGIWINDGSLNQVQVLINNSSLASQAVGPANNSTEMACAGRTFPLLGRKMLNRYALSNQVVDAGDSVLGGMRSTLSTRGLKYKYREMIEAAFQDKYWNAPATVDGEFTQMEANFSLFWGLAIQMYESTLVSNMAPYDVFARGGNDPETLAQANAALTEQQKLGLEVFIREDRGACVSCHSGSSFTSASVNVRAEGAFDLELEAFAPPEPFERMRMVDGNTAVYDGGFYNIGVTGTQDDLCIGAEVGGYPLSYSRQAASGLIADQEAGLDAAGDANDFAVVGGPVQFDERVGVDGACKTPSLRNVELTAPYFHNGGHLTLDQVMISYMAKFKHLYADDNVENLAPQILQVDIDGIAQDGVSVRHGEREALIAFMKSLTDERVRLHKAPFDHPSLKIVNGSNGIDRNRNGMADDLFTSIPAVGAGGLSAPLPLFLE